MRRIALFLACLAVLVACSPVRAQDANADELPLYRQFRVLSGLPWMEAGSTRQAVLERIFHEPHPLVRYEVLREYLHTALPVEEFPAAFKECLALEQADFPGAVPEFVMRAWAERDPAAALRRCQTLFDLVIEGAPLGFSTWSKPIRTGNLEKTRDSSYWFGSRGVVHACWKGMAAAELAPDSRKKLEAEFTAAYARRFQASPPKDVEEPAQIWARRHRSSYVNHPATISSDAEMGGEFLRLLTAPPEEIPGMLKWPREPWDDVLFPRALIRWMNGDAKKAPQIMERVLEAYDPRRTYRDDPAVMDVIPAEFLVEWAILDGAAFMAWATEKHRGWRAEAVYLTVMSKEKEYDVETKDRAVTPKASKSECHKLWITLDPQGALPRLFRYYGEEPDIHAALDDLWRSDPPANYWRKVVAAFSDMDRRGSGNEAWGVTMVSATVDFRAMIKQYGLPWCLHSGELKESQVADIFSNRQAMGNELGLRNTFSALRTWAILRPREMRAWIDGEKFTAGLREALLWLLDNAGNSQPVPAPEKPR
jgi:hypothetical protein